MNKRFRKVDVHHGLTLRRTSFGPVRRRNAGRRPEERRDMRALRLLALTSFLALVGALVAPSVAKAQPIGEWDTGTEATDDFPSAAGPTA
jgi:hypothetical protein